MGGHFFFFASCTSNRGVVSRIVKELQYLGIKEKLNRKWDVELNGVLEKKRKWPVNSLKSLQHHQLSGIM